MAMTTQLREHPLAELFPRASADGAPLRHWAAGTWLVEHGEPKPVEERIAERLPSPEALAELAPELPVSVYGFLDTARARGHAGAGAEVQPLYTFPVRTIRDAVPLYQAGHTLICWCIRDHLPEARQRGLDIIEALGLPHLPVAARGLREPWTKSSLFVMSLVYTPAGALSGLGLHFDLFDSIIVQLRGCKRWRIGRHPQLEFPLYNEESAAKLDYPPSLPRVATRTEFVGELEDVELRRGSVLLLPRGNYHTTLVDAEASLSIGYHFTLPTWSDLILAALERRLSREPWMRTSPFGAFHLHGPSERSKQQMVEAAERAREALSDPHKLLEQDLLAELASQHQASFRWVTNAAARLLPDEAPKIINYGGLGLDVEWPAEAAPLCRWLVDGAADGEREWFNLDDALLASGDQLSPLELWNRLQEAVEAGLLERRWGR